MSYLLFHAVLGKNEVLTFQRADYPAGLLLKHLSVQHYEVHGEANFFSFGRDRLKSRFCSSVVALPFRDLSAPAFHRGTFL
jgi:hypothetical protein